MSTTARAKAAEEIDSTAAIRIVRDLQGDLDRTGDPRGFGEAMVGNWTGCWRYRVGDCRAIATIEDAIVTVFIIEVAHCREIYR